ncbi:MAG: riboflavin synthase [Kiritimatiellia bacterium]|jgi:riboflavin synthase
MFTGLVQKKGAFVKLAGDTGAAVLEIACEPWDDDPLIKGESVAVQGACLTVVGISSNGFSVDVLKETLDCTNLGRLRRGDPVNLERALRLTDRLGGHVVSGHIDGTGEILAITRQGRDHLVRIRCRPEEARYIVRKGSIAVDGISLTVSAVPAADAFEVCIIPTTWQETSLGARSVGDIVNLETDILARYLEKLAASEQATGSSLTLDKLLAAGF